MSFSEKKRATAEFTFFDLKMWPENILGFGRKEITTLISYYHKYKYISKDEKQRSYQSGLDVKKAELVDIFYIIVEHRQNM